MEIDNPVVGKLLKQYRPIYLLGKAQEILDWDSEVNLPDLASEARGDQMGMLSEFAVRAWTRRPFQHLLADAIQSLPVLDPVERAVVRELEHSSRYYTRVPQRVIVQRDRITAEATTAWRQARDEDSFKVFLPFLERIVHLSQEVADSLGFDRNPYDPLLDLHEPELTAASCQDLFGQLQPALTDTLTKIQSAPGYDDRRFLTENGQVYPQAAQVQLVEFVLSRMGFDFDRGRLDISAHPFTQAMDPTDVRLTVSYNEDDFTEALSSATHEGGHGLYYQGINPDFTKTPLYTTASTGVSEAVARFWEKIIGRDPSLIVFLAPILKDKFPDQLAATTEDQLIRQLNFVRPGLRRTVADEVTYSLHVILRFELEDDLINGRLQPKDLPEAWRDKMQKYLGVTPKSDKDGVLQDIHWAVGEFGYFPGYALGNLYGAQLMSRMKQEVDIEANLQNGQLQPIKEWLDTNVHQHGALFRPSELMQRITGEALDPRYFIDYINQKYQAIYGFSS